VVSPDSAGCGEYGETPFYPGLNSRWPPRSHLSAFGARFPTSGAMAKEGKGRGRENRWCPHVQGTWNLHGDPFVPAGTPSVKHYSLLTANPGLIFLTLPTLGAMSHFTDFRRHGSIREGEGEGNSMVSPCAGDMEPPSGRFFSTGDTTVQTLSDLARSLWPHFSHFIPLYSLLAPWPEAGRHEAMFCWCPHTRPVVGSMGTHHLTTLTSQDGCSEVKY
jgi:hypothetical protein